MNLWNYHDRLRQTFPKKKSLRRKTSVAVMEEKTNQAEDGWLLDEGKVEIPCDVRILLGIMVNKVFGIQ